MNSYTKIPNDILDDDNLDPMERLLLIYLVKYHNDNKGYAFPSMKVLTKHLGYSHDRYTRDKINSLIEKGYIRKETIKQKNRYYIIGEVPNVPKVSNVPKVPNVPQGEVPNVPNSRVPNVPTKITNKIKKKITNRNNSNFDLLISEYTNDIELIEALKGYIEMRKNIKKPLTNRALKMKFTKLDEIAKDDNALKVRLTDEATNKCWMDIYPLKEIQHPLKAKEEKEFSKEEMEDVFSKMVGGQ